MKSGIFLAGPELKERRVAILSTVVFFGFTLSVAFHYIASAYYGQDYPYSTFLFKPIDHFNDLYNVYYLMKVGIKPYSHYYLPYFPLGLILMKIVSWLPFSLLLGLLFALFLGLVFYQNGRFLVPMGNPWLFTQQLFLLSFVPYPVLFALDRANIELLLYIFLALFFYLYLIKGKRWGLVFLVLAIGMKLYPATLLILPLADRKIRDALWAGILSLVAMLISYALVGEGSIFSAIKKHLAALGKFEGDFAGGGIGIQHNHSLYGLLRGINEVAGELIGLSLFKALYYGGVLLFFAFIVYYVVWIEQKIWKRVALLTISMILFPFTSFDYTLIHLFFPLVFFVNGERERFDLLYTLLFAIPLIPVDYYYIKEDISISAIIYPLALLALMVLIIYEGIKGFRGSKNRDPGKLGKDGVR